MSIVVKQRPTTSTSSSSAAANLFSPIPACFRRARSLSKDAPPTITSTSTSVYATDFGACVLTWTRTLLGRTLRIQLPLQKLDYSIKIRSKPFLFWRNQGLKSFDGEVQILWDFRRCKFGSETEAESGFYLAVTVAGELALLIGDSAKSVYTRLRLEKVVKRKRVKKQRLVLRKEHASGTRFFRASAPAVGNGETNKVKILIEHFYSGRDSGIRISFNGTCVLEVEHLVWKFRGSEQVEYDGVCVNVSWDVYGWLFCNNSSDKVKKQKTSEDLTTTTVEGNGNGSGVFVFDFEKVMGLEDDEEVSEDVKNVNVWERMRRSEMSLWSTLSSISSSRSSWGSTSSVMDWWSTEEMEMGCGGGGGFSLVVCATDAAQSETAQPRRSSRPRKPSGRFYNEQYVMSKKGKGQGSLPKEVC